MARYLCDVWTTVFLFFEPSVLQFISVIIKFIIF